MPVLELPSTHLMAGPATIPAVALAVGGGERDPERVADLMAIVVDVQDWLYVLCVMCWPDNDAERQRIKCALDAAEIVDGVSLARSLGFSVEVDGDAAALAFDREAPQALLGAALVKDALGHAAAGWVLRWIVSRTLHGLPADASLGRAADVFGEWCTMHRIYGGGAAHIKRNIWPRYAPVSHFWAALQLLQECGVHPGAPDFMPLLLGTAQWLLEQAESIVPIGRRKGETILSSASAWSVPSAYVQRMEDGSIGTRILWSTDLRAHDIRNKVPPAQLV